MEAAKNLFLKAAGESGELKKPEFKGLIIKVRGCSGGVPARITALTRRSLSGERSMVADVAVVCFCHVLAWCALPTRLLLLQLSKVSKGQAPKDADLDAAFILADEDHGGTVDLAEFINLYAAVLAGDVHGLSDDSDAQRRATFASGLQEKRARWREMTEEKVAAATKIFNEAAGDAEELKKSEFKILVVKVGTRCCVTLT